MKSFDNELTKLVVIVAGLLVSGAVCFLMIVSGWEQQGITWHLTYGAVRTFDLGVGTVFVLPVGFFLGLAGLVLLDDYKRAQGIILWAAIFLGGIILYVSDIFVTRIDWTEGTVLLSLVLGAGFGLYLGGGFNRDEFDSELREYPKAINWVFKLAAVVVVVALAEAALAYDSPILTTADGFDFHGTCVPRAGVRQYCSDLISRRLSRLSRDSPGIP